MTRGAQSSTAQAEKAFNLNPNDSLLLAGYGIRLAFSGKWNRGLEMIEHAMILNPAHPDFFHIPFVIDFYHRGELDNALREAREIDMPDFYWTYMILTAIYADMNDSNKAQETAKHLSTLYPDIEHHARSELEKWQLPTGLIDKILNGLKKSGLQIT